VNQLEELRKDLLVMSHDERMAKLREIREDRVVSKTHKTKRVAGEKKRVNTLGKRVDALSDEEKAKLISLLEAQNES
jgi:hypothetical protein